MGISLHFISSFIGNGKKEIHILPMIFRSNSKSWKCERILLSAKLLSKSRNQNKFLNDLHDCEFLLSVFAHSYTLCSHIVAHYFVGSQKARRCKRYRHTNIIRKLLAVIASGQCARINSLKRWKTYSTDYKTKKISTPTCIYACMHLCI